MVLFGNRRFVNPILLGLGMTREPLQIMDTEFTVVVGVIAVNPPFGAALSFVLMTATLLLTVTSNGVAHRRYRR